MVTLEDPIVTACLSLRMSLSEILGHFITGVQ